MDVPLTKFSLKAIALMKNRAFASYWLFYFLNNEGSIVKGDVRQLQRLVTLLFVIKPRGLDYFGLSKGSVIVRYNGRLYSLETTVNSWDQNNLPSFSIITKDQNVRFYLVQPGVNFSGHASKLKLQNLRNFVCTYQAKEYIYDARVQRMLSPVMLNNNRLLLMPKGANSDLIFLSEIREYLNKYGYDDPSKGFGTRMFYVDEAPLINKGLYPSSANSVRIMTIISKDEVALHSTSSKFLKKNVGELVNYGTTMARVPRMFILSLERIDQLINSHIISIQM